MTLITSENETVRAEFDPPCAQPEEVNDRLRNEDDDDGWGTLQTEQAARET